MARQLALTLAAPVRPTRRGRGGARPGAGRKPNGARAGHAHAVRPYLSPRDPVHVVLRIDRALGRLRRRSAYHAVRQALLTSLARGDFRVVHLSIQRHHIHLICEADDRLALSRGVRGLSISAARRLNAAITHDRRLPRPRRGRVFVDRYHATAITSPTHARHELAYVLGNWRHHREDVFGAARRAKVDPYSSAVAFPGWAGHDAPFAWPRDYLPLPVAYPTTWLLTVGWRRAGPPLSTGAVPGGPAKPAKAPRRS